MSTLQSQIQTSSAEFKANQEFHFAEAKKLEERIARTREGGGTELRKKHESRGKLFVRDRIEKLLAPMINLFIVRGALQLGYFIKQ